MMLGRRDAIAAAILLPSMAYAADADATAPIAALAQALVATMKSGRNTPFAQRYAALQPAVERAFDLPAILHASVGLRWASLTSAEQQQLLDVFRKFTVSSYTANFDSYAGEKIDVVPGNRTIGSDQVVQTQISGNGEPTSIDYVMHRGPDGWRAIDVLLNGSISQVAVNRSDWRSLLASGGDALTAQLQRKVTDLSGGAIR